MPIKKLSLYHLKSYNSYRKQTVFGMDRMVIVPENNIIDEKII